MIIHARRMWTVVLTVMVGSCYTTEKHHENRTQVVNLHALERHLAHRYGVLTSVAFEESGTSADQQRLILRDTVLVREENGTFLECSISEQAWNAQRAAVQHQVSNPSPYTEKCASTLALATPGFLFGYLLGMHAGGRFLSMRIDELPITLVYGLTALIAQYLLLRARDHATELQRYKIQVLADHTRIPGFQKIAEQDNGTMRIRSEFALEALLPVDRTAPWPKCIHRVFCSGRCPLHRTYTFVEISGS